MTCQNCGGEGWVCENHADTPWVGGDSPCCGGAGAPCRVCRAELAWAESLYEKIKHGDDQHKSWLREAIHAFFAGSALPDDYQNVRVEEVS